MILPFKEKINRQETCFEERIQEMLIQTGKFTSLEIIDFTLKNHGYKMPRFIYAPKLHTIREDINNRWQIGNKIHAVYNNRSKNQYQIAPTFECKGIQIIELNFDISYCLIRVVIENQVKYYPYLEHEGVERRRQSEWLSNFAKNDGFDKVRDFQDFFEPTLKKNKSFTFKGKIIHFTDLLY